LKHRILALLMLALALAAVPRERAHPRATGSLSAASLAYLPGSTIPIDVSGFSGPFRFFVSGPGTIAGDRYRIADDARGAGTVIAAGPHGLATHTFTLAPTPDPRRPFIAVASYDDGVVLHETTAPYRATAALGIGGAPADVAIDPSGTLASAVTDGTDATLVTLDPWHAHSYDGVPFADALAFDPRNGALYITNRDVGNAGALTRITRDGEIKQRILGLTAEGIAIDAARGRIYVANVNDGTVSIVDATTLVERRRFRVVDRVFSLALSRDGSRLYAVSNESVNSPFATAGSVVIVDVGGDRSRIVARSGPLDFPIGIALDESHGRIYVTDEDADAIDVLDARTLQASHPPLRTCTTPWKPTLDDGMLYVPCARNDQIDVFQTATLRHASGAPFATGGYPLAVAVWHGRASGNDSAR
jgi:DNA-binding beta-propeller fold protein YncE